MEYITVDLLGKKYQVSCPPELKEELIKSASYLNNKLLEIHNKGKIINFEGMLITAAINLAYEVMQKEYKNIANEQHLVENLTLMKNKLNHAINLSSTKLKSLENY